MTRSRPPRPARRIGLLLSLATALLGGVCDPDTSGDPGAAAASLRAKPVNVYLSQAGTLFGVNVQFDTVGSVQAFDIAVTWNPAHVEFVSAGPHPDFDDDGQLFGAVTVDPVAGKASGIRDARHGPTSLTGKKGIATLQFRSVTLQASTIEASGRVANPQGIQSAKLSAKTYVSASQP